MPSWVAVLPFFIVIPIAIFTKQVVPGLVIGLLTGCYLLHPSPLAGLHAAVTYLVTEASTPGNVRLILFLYGFGAFVGLVRVSGGVRGIAKWMESRIHTTRGAYILTWISALATFMAPDFRIITIAPIVSHIFARLRVPPMRVAYIIDVTATPLCAVIPIATAFVGYMVGLISTSLRHVPLPIAPYPLLLRSIPFNLFAWIAMLYGLLISFLPMRHVEKTLAAPSESENITIHRRLATVEMGSMGATAAMTQDTLPSRLDILAEKAPPVALRLLLPLALLLCLTIILTWLDGVAKGAGGLFNAFVKADTAAAMLEALFITLVATVVYYLIRRQPISRTMFAVVAGGNEMMNVIVLLVLVWGVSAVSTDLGFATFTEHELARYVPHLFIAPVLFVVGSAISYVIGSSFGTWAILLPLGFAMAPHTVIGIALVAGAVFASGTFGGFASPLSDNTVAMATVMKLPIVDYARYKLTSALVMVGVSAVGFAVLGLVLKV